MLSRWMSSPRFAARALAFWPTRFVARRRASELFDLISGFVYSQVLHAAVRLRLFETLRTPSTLTTVSSKTGLSEAAASRLLRATTALDLTTELPAGHYGLGRLGAVLAGDSGLQALIQHHDMLYRDLTEPTQLFVANQRTTLGDYWAYSRSNQTISDHSSAAQVSDYSGLMAASQPMISAQILDSYDFTAHSQVMDIGGGTGRFLLALRQRYPQLQLTLFDLAAVVAVSDQSQLDAQQIQLQSGDFLHDPLPGAADLITLVRILHDHNDEAVAVLLQRIFDVLPDNGTLLIAEPMSDARHTRRVGEAYFNMYFLAMGKGDPRTVGRLRTMLQRTGFCEVRVRSTTLPLICTVITATKPAVRQSLA